MDDKALVEFGFLLLKVNATRVDTTIAAIVRSVAGWKLQQKGYAGTDGQIGAWLSGVSDADFIEALKGYMKEML